MNTGVGSVFRRGEVWWVSYYYRGERFRESAKSKLKKDATSLLKRRTREISEGAFIGPDEGLLTFEDLVGMIETDYKVNARKSARRLKYAVANLRQRFGRHRALDITTDRITQYIADRQDQGAASSTIRKETAALKRMFTLAVRANRLSRAPHVPQPQVRNVRENFLSSGDVEEVVQRLPKYLKPVARFAALTGWRLQETLGLKWSDVDFESGEVRLLPGKRKNDEGRSFPIHALPPLEKLLRDQLDLTRTLERETGEIIPHVFHREGKRIISLRKAWSNACTLAGLEGTWFHDLRRTAVRNLEKAGVSRSVAMKLTGHRTESVYRRYAIADQRSLEEGGEKLAKLHAGTETKGRTVVPITEAKQA